MHKQQIIGGVLLAAIVGILFFSGPLGASAALLQTMTPTPAGVMLFEDDFATYSQRWHEAASPKAEAAYRDGMFNIRIVSPGVSLWSLPDFTTTLDRYTLEVTMQFLGGSADSQFGLLLGYTSDEAFFALLLSAQGEWFWGQRSGGDWITVPLEAIDPPSPVGESPLHLRVDILENTLSFALDDQESETISLPVDWAGGRFGLIARAGHGYADVVFDDVIVMNLTETIQP
ncbi:MAG: hypothetical protein HY866_02935 [Chloroflexi bacterium]|nr:hypothetical protein [Chloroflexota bacterium]